MRWFAVPGATAPTRHADLGKLDGHLRPVAANQAYGLPGIYALPPGALKAIRFSRSAKGGESGWTFQRKGVI